MGSACCVAARDRTIINGSSSDVMPRNVRYSPSWSFRWDNRGRVAEEETSMNWLSDGVGTNDRLDNKSQTTIETANASEVGSPLEGFQSLTWQKSPPSEGNLVCQSGPLNSRNPSEVKDLREIPVALEPSPTRMSTSTHLVSSFSASPMSSSQGHLPPSSLTISRWPHRSPGHRLLRQVSDNRTPGTKSPNFSISEEGSPFILPGWSNESYRGSHGGSSDGFSEPVTTSHRDRWSFDSESLSFGGRVSSPSITQMCGVCSRHLSEKSSGSQKIIATNELDVVAILICGHVYHAECLECMTPGINKYDPACPVCTFGEKKALKLSEKALRAEMDLKTKIAKKLRCRVMDGDSVLFDCRHEGRGPRVSSSSSMKSSIGKPFLRKHFSFGSKGSRSMSETKSSWKKGFFWARSGKD